jgi:hypothetical protein
VKVALIVDGLGEVAALPILYSRIRTTHALLKPVHERRLQPLARPEQIASIVARRCEVLADQGVDLIVVLLDRETRDECPGAFASRLQAMIVQQIRFGSFNVAVVLKNRRLENWLVADLECLNRAPRLFADRHRVVQSVPVGNADGVEDAFDILQRACGPRGRYNKVEGAKAICTHLDPGRAALNSRSFRRFLRVLEDSRYLDQSRLPNRDP